MTHASRRRVKPKVLLNLQSNASNIAKRDELHAALQRHVDQQTAHHAELMDMAAKPSWSAEDASCHLLGVSTALAQKLQLSAAHAKYSGLGAPSLPDDLALAYGELRIAAFDFEDQPHTPAWWVKWCWAIERTWSHQVLEHRDPAIRAVVEALALASAGAAECNSDRLDAGVAYRHATRPGSKSKNQKSRVIAALMRQGYAKEFGSKLTDQQLRSDFKQPNKIAAYFVGRDDLLRENKEYAEEFHDRPATQQTLARYYKEGV